MKEKKKSQGAGKRKQQRKRKQQKGKRNQKSETMQQRKDNRAVYKGNHCEYIDLCALDTMADGGCVDGQKFVVKVLPSLFSCHK